MNIVPNRVFSSASVQTEPLPSPTPLEVTLVDVTSQPASIPDFNESPVHLPSPVSADHGLEPHFDKFPQLDEDADDVWFNFECISFKLTVSRYLKLNGASHRWTLVLQVVLNLPSIHPYLLRINNQHQHHQKLVKWSLKNLWC